MSEEETIRHLVEKIGISEREARLRLKDDDLWLVDPEMRSGLSGEAAVEQWKEAVAVTGEFIEMHSLFYWLGDATQHLILDAHERAQEALRRVRERVGDTETE